MSGLFDQLAELSEAMMDRFSEEQKYDLMVTTNTDFLRIINSELQNNLYSWSDQKTKNYARRVTLYSTVNTALVSIKKSESIDKEIIQKGINAMREALKHAMDEYGELFDNGTKEQKQQLIDEWFLPHLLVIRYLEKHQNTDDKINDLKNLNFVFKSSDHIRFENKIHVSGPHGGAARAIKVEPINESNDTFTVSTFNLDGNHPLWQNNVQMAPKQMKIISRQDDEIELRGYGSDMFGNAFSDYGLTIHFNGNEVIKCVLHMHDRNVDIEYQK